MVASSQGEVFSTKILDRMLEGCQILDFEWRYVYVNDAAEKHSRRDRSELIGRRLPEVYPGIENTPMFESLKQCAESRTAGKSMNEFTYPDGSKAWFDLWFEPVSEGMMVLSLDISEHKKAERQVEKLNRAVAKRIKAEGRLNRTLDELRQANEQLQAEVAERQSAEESLGISLRFLEIVNRQRELKPLLDEFRTEIIRFTGCEAVGIRVLDDEGNIPYQTYSGFSRSFFESESPLSIKTDQCMCINVIKGDADPSLPFYSPGGSFYMNGTTRFLATVSEEDKGSTRNICNKVGYESVALIPFRRDNRILGLIHVADRRENMVPLQVVETLEKAAMQLGPAFERVRAENLLSESESRYRGLFENNHTVILLIDPEDGSIVDANPAAERYYGWTREELRRVKMDAINPLPHAEVMSILGRARREQRNHFFFNHRLADGSIRDVEVFSGPIQLQGRTLLFAVVHDNTERKKAEEALRESEEHYRSLFDNMLNGFAYCQMLFENGRPADFVYLDVNDAFESLTGLRNVAGKKVSEVIPGVRESDPELLEVYGRVASTGQPTYFETHVKALDMWFSISVYSPNKGYFVAVFDVITDRKKAESALRESEQKLRLFIENAPAAISMLDRDMRYMFVSRRWLQDYQLNDDNVIGRSHYEIFPEIPERWKEIHRRCLAGAVESCDEDPFVRQDGRTDWLKWEIRPWHEASGSVGGLIIVSELINERKMVEGALRASEERFSKAFYANPAAVLLTRSEDGLILDCNETYQRLLGFSRDELILRTGIELNIFVEAEDRQEIVDQLRNQGSIRDQETRLRAKSGDMRIVLYSIVQIEVEGEACLLSIFVDITERKRAEEALRASEERLRLAQEAANAGTWEWNLVTGENFWSDELWNLYGLEKDKVQPSYEAWRQVVVPEDRPMAEAAAAEAARNETELNFEWRVQYPDDSRRWLMSRGRPVRDEQGRIMRYLGVVMDITERKQAEQEREKLEEQYRQAQKLEAVGRLAGGVAHDFNNMLQVIQGYAEMTIEEIGNESPWLANMEEIQKAARRSSDLTRQLLAFARKQTVDPKVLDLNDTVSGMLKMLRRLIGEDIDLAWLPGHDLQPVKIDPSQIDQILANLAVNARDAIDGVGRVTIETDNATIDETYCIDHPEFMPGDFVLIAVSDDGCGMDKETAARIFEPFFTTKGAGRGTGLGLATVYGIVKQNNGFVNVYSESGHGTTFKIYLPKFEADSTGIRAAPALQAPSGGEETILLVEDEVVILNIGRAMLQRLGYHVLAAQRPGEAIRLAEEYSGDIHLLITDVVMPEMNGRDLALHLVALQPDMKCLFISGYTANLIAHRGVLDEGVNFLPKPFSLESLSRKIREVLD